MIQHRTYGPRVLLWFMVVGVTVIKGSVDNSVVLCMTFGQSRVYIWEARWPRKPARCYTGWRTIP